MRLLAGKIVATTCDADDRHDPSICADKHCGNTDATMDPPRLMLQATDHTQPIERNALANGVARHQSHPPWSNILMIVVIHPADATACLLENLIRSNHRCDTAAEHAGTGQQRSTTVAMPIPYPMQIVTRP